MLRLALASLALFAFTPAADADCALYGLAAKVVTRANTEVPLDGGILVMAAPEPHGKLETGDAAIDKSWRFQGSTAELKFDSIAPGLAVIRLPLGATGRMTGGELVDGKKKSLVVVKATDIKRAPLPAPQIKNIVAEDRISRRVSGRVGVTLDSQPTNVVALVLADAKGKPRSFALVGTPGSVHATAPASPAVLYAYEHHDCHALPNGTVQSKAGELVTVLFVDDAGRVSPPSKPFKIAKAPTP